VCVAHTWKDAARYVMCTYATRRLIISNERHKSRNGQLLIETRSPKFPFREMERRIDGFTRRYSRKSICIPKLLKLHAREDTWRFSTARESVHKIFRPFRNFGFVRKKSVSKRINPHFSTSGNISKGNNKTKRRERERVSHERV